MYLSNQSLLIIVVVGIVAGWLAGRVIEGRWIWLDRRFVGGADRRIHRRLAVAAAGYSSGSRHCCPYYKRLHWRDRASSNPSFGRRGLEVQRPMGQAVVVCRPGAVSGISQL